MKLRFGSIRFTYQTSSGTGEVPYYAEETSKTVLRKFPRKSIDRNLSKTPTAIYRSRGFFDLFILNITSFI